MARIRFPYGKSCIEQEIPDSRLLGVLVPDIHNYSPEQGPEQLIAAAMACPSGTPRLFELAKNKKKIVIIDSDHTRPVPSRLLIPPMLREIRQSSPNAEITILIATGCHRKTTREELLDKFGPEIVENERIVIHDCDDQKMLIDIGRLPSGGRLVVNRLAVECDLLCAVGFIEPHFFAGFSGGRKSVLPGIAGRQTVVYNHNAAFIASRFARTGITEGNPIHADMLWAARRVNVQYILNVVLGADKQVIYAVAGDCDAAHIAGREFLKRRCMVSAIPADIVITTNGGYPLDQNIYQTVKGMTAAEATVKDGGVIIALSQSSDGHGGMGFYETFKKEKNLERMIAGFMAVPPEKTAPDQWQSQIFARVLQKATVLYLSDVPDEIVRDMHMIPVHSLSEAIARADTILGRCGTITAIPDGVSVIVGEAD
jgi:nickel-dependent lactate racemase